MNAMRYFMSPPDSVRGGLPTLIARDHGTPESYIQGLLNHEWTEVYVVPRPTGAVAEEYQVTGHDTEWRVTMPNGDVHQFDPTTLDILRAEAQALLFLIEEQESHEVAHAEHERNQSIWRWINWFSDNHVSTSHDQMVAAITKLVEQGVEPPDA